MLPEISLRVFPWISPRASYGISPKLLQEIFLGFPLEYLPLPEILQEFITRILQKLFSGFRGFLCIVIHEISSGVPLIISSRIVRELLYRVSAGISTSVSPRIFHRCSLSFSPGIPLE